MFYALCSGCLTANPQRRQGSRAPFATGSLRVQDGEDWLFVSVIAFGDKAAALLEHAAGAAIEVSGRAKLTTWTGRDGAEKHGVSITIEQIITAKPRARGSATRRPQSTRRQVIGNSPGLLDDRLDDLYADVVVP
jgi:single-stranded DNA-binding protein